MSECEVLGQFRMRALGGGSLAGARLFRSAQLTDISPDEARFMTSQIGIQAIYDIRNEWEVYAAPEPYLVGAKTIQLEPLTTRRRKSANERFAAGVIGEYGVPEERMIVNYRRYVQEYPLIGRALRALAAEQVPALIHCVNGKDRTGVICAVIMKACGVHDDDIMQDYLITNEINADYIREEAEGLSAGMTEHELAILMSFLEARPAYLHAFFDEIERQYGSFQAYLTNGVRLNPIQQLKLRALYARS